MTEAFQYDIEQPGADSLRLNLRGRWRIDAGLPDADAGMESWDSALITFLLRLHAAGREREVEFDLSGLPDGAQRLLALSQAVPPRGDTAPAKPREPLLTQLGHAGVREAKAAGEMLSFVGEATLSFVRLLRGKPAFRRSDFFLLIQQTGAEALPIVSIISLLVGLILAFVGAVQLRWFGAEIYVADLVGIAMTREMAPIMTGIVLAGRTGASFAANIGTMQGNEEVDALSTLGISPMDFLVLPRLLAMLLMMPLLVLYADFVGIFGGWVVGVGMLDLTSAAYVAQTLAKVTADHFLIGLTKSLFFGLIVATAGCMRGLQAGRSAAAVGNAATSAVVTGIVYIIVVDAIFAVICNIVGI
ncbi:MAG: ABC transporter permease [Rhodovibrio sp.]|nr:ABC transporter permease [Rhodovibrio sp.]